ncbi:MAG TPA: hypothetical protein VIT19_00805 [Pyrinomonadaceae bacterium]
MFCPSCGTEQHQTLSYCNRCGANLRPLQSGVPPGKLVGASWAISVAVALVTLGGFGMIFGLVLALISSGMSLSAGGIGLVILISLIILTIDWLLIRQLSRVLNLPRAARETATVSQPALNESSPTLLADPPQPVSSVTDRTTRTFEPVVRERDTKR